MRPGGIAKQKTVDSSAGAASVLMGRWREPLRLTLHVSTRKKASLPGLQRLIPFQLLHHPRPVFLKGVGACAPCVRALQLAGQFPGSLVGACRAFTHPCSSGGDLLCRSFVSRLHKSFHLGILFHMTLLLDIDECHGRSSTGQTSSLM